MAKKTPKRVKHVPQRTCVGCRQTLAKRSLIRVVRTADGVRVDPSGKAAGRGAYLHDRKECWERGLKGALAHALKVELTDADRETLRSFMQSLPEDSADQQPGGSENPKGAGDGQGVAKKEQEDTLSDALGNRTMNR